MSAQVIYIILCYLFDSITLYRSTFNHYSESLLENIFDMVTLHFMILFVHKIFCHIISVLFFKSKKRFSISNGFNVAYYLAVLLMLVNLFLCIEHIVLSIFIPIEIFVAISSLTLSIIDFRKSYKACQRVFNKFEKLLLYRWSELLIFLLLYAFSEIVLKTMDFSIYIPFFTVVCYMALSDLVSRFQQKFKERYFLRTLFEITLLGTLIWYFVRCKLRISPEQVTVTFYEKYILLPMLMYVLAIISEILMLRKTTKTLTSVSTHSS